MKYLEQTFVLGRKCQGCGKPIADQEHKSRTHCERYVLDDGSVVSCKDDKNAALRKVADEPYRELTALQKEQTAQLQKLLAAYGATVTVEQLNQYGIQLDKALSLQKKAGLLTFFFVFHRLDQQRDQTFIITTEPFKTNSYVL